MTTDGIDIDGIDTEPVTAWFEAEIDGARGPLTFELIAGGHSNLTFRVEDGAGGGYVLRRPPLGPLLPKAHDMSREHRIVSALGPTDVPVPPALGLCLDEGVNERPFYVMRFVEGTVLHDREVAGSLSPETRTRVGLDVIDVLAALHGVDPDAVGLGDLGRKEDYVARQLRRWSKQWEQSKTRELPAMDEVRERLERDVPEQVGASVVHGDYRLGNFIVGEDGRLAAVLDWELCTLGDPLADLGYLLNDWVRPDEDVPPFSENAPTRAGGFPARDELLERYASATGRDVSRIAYYRALSYWRAAAIHEGVYARYLAGAYGEIDPAALERFSESSPRLAELAVGVFADADS